MVEVEQMTWYETSIYGKFHMVQSHYSGYHQFHVKKSVRAGNHRGTFVPEKPALIHTKSNMVENDNLFLNLEFKMVYFLAFWQF